MTPKLKAYRGFVSNEWLMASCGEVPLDLRRLDERGHPRHDIILGRDDARVDIGDVDGDGCLDVVALGSNGYGLLRGHHCMAR